MVTWIVSRQAESQDLGESRVFDERPMSVIKPMYLHLRRILLNSIRRAVWELERSVLTELSVPWVLT